MDFWNTETVTTKFCKKKLPENELALYKNHNVNSKHTPAVILPDPARNDIDPVLSKTVDKLKAFY
jgi:hypothetical protein